MRHLCCCVYAERAPAELEQERGPRTPSPPCGGPGVSRQLTDWRLARRTTPGTSSAATSSADHPGLRLTPTSSTASRMLLASAVFGYTTSGTPASPPCSVLVSPCTWSRAFTGTIPSSLSGSMPTPRPRTPLLPCLRSTRSSALASSTLGPSFGLIAADADLRGARVPAVAVARGVVRGSGQSERPEEGGWARQNWRTA